MGDCFINFKFHRILYEMRGLKRPNQVTRVDLVKHILIWIRDEVLLTQR
jgi:hypothetical protein